MSASCGGAPLPRLDLPAVRIRPASALALIAMLLLAFPASGAPQNRKEAGERYQKGVSLYKEGDYAAALAEFKAAFQAAPTWEVLYNIGLTERRLFKYGQAVQTLNRYLEEGGKKVPKDRRANVEKELEQIRELTAVITIKVEGKPAKITVDGEVVGNSPLSEPVLLGPGPHVFKAEREGFNADEKAVEIVSKTKVEVALAPKPKEDTSPAEVIVDSDPTGAVITVDGKLAGLAPTKVSLTAGGHEVLADLEGYATTRQEVLVSAGQSRKVVVKMERGGGDSGGATRGPRRVPVAGLITAGAGAGVLIGGILLNLQAQAAAKRVSDIFRTGGTWDKSAIAVESSGIQAQTWSWILTVAGSAALATGVVMSIVTLVSGSGEEEESSAFWLAPTPGGATVGWSLSW